MVMAYGFLARVYSVYVLFFFSSRRRHTRFDCDWSSDVCSSDLDGAAMAAQLIAKNIDAAPFYSIHHYYINKAAKAAGEEIIPLPFVEVGFKIYADRKSVV